MDQLDINRKEQKKVPEKTNRIVKVEEEEDKEENIKVHSKANI